MSEGWKQLRLNLQSQAALQKEHFHSTFPDRARPHYVVLYVTDCITSAMVATVAEIDSGSTLHDTCLTTEVQKSFTKPTVLQHATAASSMKSPSCATCKKKDAKPVILSAEAS